MKTSLMLVFLLLLGGCVSSWPVTSEIVVYHELPGSIRHQRFAFLPDKDQEGSLEYNAFANRIRAKFRIFGLEETSIEEADLLLSLHYGIDAGHDVQEPHPILGTTGYNTTHLPGTVTRTGDTVTVTPGTTISTPTIGVVGVTSTTATIYTRTLTLDILDNASRKQGKTRKVLESKVVSSGTSRMMAAVIPVMIDALFTEFPGKSGKPRIVELPMEF
ncbi:MAG: DUF4136 domain-containing protein [Magnetococcales bacterium]|nr:DUF4136 domain-containing protein [Magnetococcales bacterium]